MFATKIEVNERTDMADVIQDLDQRASEAGVAPEEVDECLAQVRVALEPLLTRGRQLHALGSQMHVERKVRGTSYDVTIEFRIGVRKSRLSRLLGALKGR